MSAASTGPRVQGGRGRSALAGPPSRPASCVWLARAWAVTRTLPSPARALVPELWLSGRPHRHLLYSGLCISGGGRVWGCKAGPGFPSVSPPTCFEGSALSPVLLDSKWF